MLQGDRSRTSADEVPRDVVRGQYGPGWVDGAAGRRATARSRRSTRLRDRDVRRVHAARSTNWRWAGVPFYLRTGKRLAKRATEIAIQFKEVPPTALFREVVGRPGAEPAGAAHPARRGHPRCASGPRCRGSGRTSARSTWTSRYGSSFDVDSPDAYETLLLDALLGDASLFTRADEVEAAWGIVTPIIDAWLDQPAPPFPYYDAGTWGPTAADALLARDGRRWRRI